MAPLCECFVDGATHARKDGAESSRDSLTTNEENFVLFLCSVQLVLRSSVLQYCSR